MGSSQISVKFPKGTIDVAQRVEIANQLREAGIPLVAWEELSEDAPLKVEGHGGTLTEDEILQIVIFETDDDPACTWEG